MFITRWCLLRTWCWTDCKGSIPNRSRLSAVSLTCYTSWHINWVSHQKSILIIKEWIEIVCSQTRFCSWTLWNDRFTMLAMHLNHLLHTDQEAQAFRLWPIWPLKNYTAQSLTEPLPHSTSHLCSILSSGAVWSTQVLNVTSMGALVSPKPQRHTAW